MCFSGMFIFTAIFSAGGAGQDAIVKALIVLTPIFTAPCHLYQVYRAYQFAATGRSPFLEAAPTLFPRPASPPEKPSQGNGSARTSSPLNPGTQGLKEDFLG